MNFFLLISIITSIFAKGIAGSHDPVIREKLIPPFPFNKDKIIERVSKMTRKKTTEEFVRNAIGVHGNIYDYSHVIYVDAHTKVSIVCKKCGLLFSATPNSLLNGSGCPHCCRTKLIHGFGVNDLPISTRNGNKKDVAYQAWKSMIERCYSEKYKKRQQSYANCKVCEEWKFFSNFKRWFSDPKNGYIEGYQLDKDLLVLGNKIYSPETCCFLPREINSALQVSRIKDNNGIKKCKKGYAVHVSMYNKKYYIGNFKTEDEAIKEYKKAKRDYIIELADKYYTYRKITKKVYNALNTACKLWTT